MWIDDDIVMTSYMCPVMRDITFPRRSHRSASFRSCLHGASTCIYIDQGIFQDFAPGGQMSSIKILGGGMYYKEEQVNFLGGGGAYQSLGAPLK